jgi:hypothetical protein
MWRKVCVVFSNAAMIAIFVCFTGPSLGSVVLTTGDGPVPFISTPYFPIQSGNFWTYQVNGSNVTTMVLPGTVDVNGAATKAFQDDDGFTNYFTNDANGVRFHRQFVPNVFIEGLGTVDVTITLSPPVRLISALSNTAATLNSTGTAFAMTSTGETASVDYSAGYAVQGFESITVPKGTFTALRIQGTLRLGEGSLKQTIFLVWNIGIAKLI